MAKKITVLDWLNTIGSTGDPIKTSVRYGTTRYGSTEECSGKNADWLASHFPPAALPVMEARVHHVEITHDEITIYARPKTVTI